MNHSFPGMITALALTLASFAAQAQGSPQTERGRYMVLTGHCNNCHTAGYAQKEGNVPEKDWLLGSGLQGWRGPWGTTYASNLRLTVPAMTEEQWVTYIKTFRPRPPMPWWSTAATTEQDVRAMPARHVSVRQKPGPGGPARAALSDARQRAQAALHPGSVAPQIIRPARSGLSGACVFLSACS